MTCKDCKQKGPTLAQRLNRRVTILQRTSVSDEYGEPIEVWADVCTVWAAIEPLRGREYFSAMSEHADVTTRIRIRYRTGIDRTMIVRYKTPGDPGFAEFEILHIIHPEFARQELQLMCKERQ